MRSTCDFLYPLLTLNFSQLQDSVSSPPLTSKTRYIQNSSQARCGQLRARACAYASLYEAAYSSQILSRTADSYRIDFYCVAFSESTLPQQDSIEILCQHRCALLSFGSPCLYRSSSGSISSFAEEQSCESLVCVNCATWQRVLVYSSDYRTLHPL